MAIASEPVPSDPTAVDFRDFAHTGPGTLAGRYMRQFWHPVYRAQDLALARPIPIRIMSEDFTLYRGETGTPHLVAFRCAHRGTQLSTGWVEGDHLRCRFHGWVYDASGQCVEQPVEPNPFCAQVHIQSYPTEEYLGYIFAYLGGDEPPPLPRYPEFEDPDGVVEALEPSLCGCNFFQRLEVIGDEAHHMYAHRSARPAAKLVVPRVDAEETAYGVIQRAFRLNVEPKIDHFILPNIMRVGQYPKYSEELGQRHRLVWKVPVDDEHYWDRSALFLRLQGEAAARYREQARAREEAAARANTPGMLAAVLSGRLRLEEVTDRADINHLQDEVVLVGQGTIYDRQHEQLGELDITLKLIRQVWERELRALAEGRPLARWTGALPVAHGLPGGLNTEPLLG